MGAIGAPESVTAAQGNPSAPLTAPASIDPRFRGHAPGPTAPSQQDMANLYKRIAWINAANAHTPFPTAGPQTNPASLGTMSIGSVHPAVAAGIAAGSADPIHAYFDAARNQVNQQFLLQMQHMGQEDTTAQGSVNSAATTAQKMLAALGVDAKGQGAITDSAVKNNYMGAQHAVGSQYAALLKDLQGQGADTQALGAEEGARSSALQAQGALQDSTANRMAQLQSEMINDRQAGATSQQQGALGDLAQALQQGQYGAEQTKTSGLNQISMQEDQELAQLQAQAAAAARASASRGSSSGGMTPSTALALAKELSTLGSKGKSAGFDPNSILAAFEKSDPNLMSDPGRSQVVNGYLNNIAAGQQPGNSNPFTAAMALANAQSRGFGNNQDSYGGGNWGGGQGQDLMNLLSELSRGQASMPQPGPQMDPASFLQLFQTLGG